MSIRNIIDAEVLEASDELDEDSIYSAGAILEDSVPERPFAVVRMGASTRGMGHVRARNVVISVHDDPGDYTRIDRILKSIYGRLQGAEHLTLEENEGEVMSCQWSSDSDDLFDPGFRTIMKQSTYAIVGTGA